MQIQDVMTADVSFVKPDTPILEIARKMRDHDIGSTPVVDNDQLVGMVTDRDLVVRLIADAAAVMHRGKIVEQGPAAQVFDAPGADYTQRLLASWPRLRVAHA